MGELILAVDTAFERCSAGLYDPASGSLLSRREPSIGKGHAERLIGIVERVLTDAGSSYGDLARIAVTVGPGSFTGIRVGVSAARGLALALAIPAIGVSTLEAMTASVRDDRRAGAAVLAVLDARRGEVYAALFDAAGNPLRDPAALRPQSLPEYVGKPSAPLVVVGTGAAIAAQVLGLEETAIVACEALVDIAAVARIAADRMPNGPPIPLYLRGPDAKLPANPSALSFLAETTPQPVIG